MVVGVAWNEALTKAEQGTGNTTEVASPILVRTKSSVAELARLTRSFQADFSSPPQKLS